MKTNTASVTYEVSDHQATVTLCRPDRLNALDESSCDLLLTILQHAASDDSVRVVTITGQGRAFCAGGDLEELSKKDRTLSVETESATLRERMRISELLYGMAKPTIAAINGPCAGMGLCLAAATDLRFAAASAVFRTAFLGAGLSGDFGGTWFLSRVVGAAKARELYFLDSRFNAEEARQMGLVTDVLSDEDLMPNVREVADRLANSAPTALRYMKQNIRDGLRFSLTETLDQEARRHTLSGRTVDHVEAARAFLEKRPTLKPD